MDNPLARAYGRAVAAVWHPTPVSMRMLALLAVAANAGIIVSGGAVRLTKSGLGCPTWPKCTGDSLLPTASPDHSPLNMAIEFGNRTLTYLVLAAAVAVLVAALRMPRRRPQLVRLAWVQPLGVIAQAGWGGITVLTKLNPAVVAAHYLLSAALLAAATALYVRAGEGDARPVPLVRSWVARLAYAQAAVVVLLLIAGTIVTGSGPHAGDDEAPRFGFAIEEVSRIHGGLAWITVALTVVLFAALRRTGAPSGIQKSVAVLFALEMAQGVVGYVQYFLGVPALLVSLHMLGSALLWIAAVRVVFATRTRGPVPPAEPDEPADRSEPGSRTEPENSTGSGTGPEHGTAAEREPTEGDPVPQSA